MKVIIRNDDLIKVLGVLASVRQRLKVSDKLVPGLTLIKISRIGKALYPYHAAYQEVLGEAKEHYVLKDEDGKLKVKKEGEREYYNCGSDEAAAELQKVMHAPNEIELQYLLDDEDLKHIQVKPDEIDHIEMITKAGARRPGDKED